MTGRRDLGRLQGEIQELLADLWQIPRVAGMRQGFRPPSDCFRTDDPPRLVVVVDLAGVDPGEIRIVVSDRTLVVTGERRRPGFAARPSYRQMEIDYGPFQRSIPLEEDVDAEAAKATYASGLLTIALPVAPRPPPAGRTRIEVKERP
jgi:HSP20 family protein